MFSNNPFRIHRADNEVLNESKYLIPEEIPANEKTAFHGAAAGAAKDGKTSFTFAGKKYPVTMKKDLARKIADQKEATHTTNYFVGHKHATKAGMGVKVHSKGADGDNVTISHSDPKKLQKYVDNHLGGGKIKEVTARSSGYGIRNKVSDMPGVDYSWRDKYKGSAAAKAAVKKAKAQSDAKRAEYRKKMGMKEDTMNEEYSKTNKASMTIKHGYDEGDGPDNKKFAKHINKNTGATVKHHKDGSTMSFHGSDHQIHKALQIHHSDDKKGLGDLNYHKKGKTHSDDHVDGQHSYKAEGTTFRERLMSIFESDKASHYKSATKPETMDDQLKGAGAKQMKADLTGGDTKPADMEKQSHADAAKAGRAGPGTKARSNDNKKGDKKAMTSPTPVNDPTAKIVKTESYGISGNKISSSLLDAIAMVGEDYTHEIDVMDDHVKKVVSSAKKAGIKAKIHTMNGPGGGNPVVHIGHKDDDHVHKFLKKHYDPDFNKSDLKHHKIR